MGGEVCASCPVGFPRAEAAAGPCPSSPLGDLGAGARGVGAKVPASLQLQGQRNGLNAQVGMPGLSAWG